jgi:hypothetical protein
MDQHCPPKWTSARRFAGDTESLLSLRIDKEIISDQIRGKLAMTLSGS